MGKDALKFIGAGLLAIVGVVLLYLIGVFVFGGLSQLTADFRGETDKRNKVEANGSYRIAAYDHFYDLCSSIQATEDTIGNQLAERETASPERQAQIDANVVASRNVRASAIRQYNADARKSYTSGQFKASDLPFALDINAKETSCDA